MQKIETKSDFVLSFKPRFTGILRIKSIAQLKFRILQGKKKG